MARVQSNYKEVIERLKKRFNSSLDIGSLEALGDAAIVEVQKRTRLGNDKFDEKFSPIQPKTVEARKNSGDLSPFTTPSRSNQTATGQMVEAMDKRVVVDNQKKYVEIFLKSERDDGPTNQDVALGNKKRGREFFGLSPKNKQRLRTLIRNILQKITRY